jgi:hypothetical protein
MITHGAARHDFHINIVINEDRDSQLLLPEAKLEAQWKK